MPSLMFILALGHAMEFKLPRSMLETKLQKAYKTLLKHRVLDLGHAMGFKVSRLMIEAKCKIKAYKIVVNMTFSILDMLKDTVLCRQLFGHDIDPQQRVRQMKVGEFWTDCH